MSDEEKFGNDEVLEENIGEFRKIKDKNSIAYAEMYGLCIENSLVNPRSKTIKRKSINGLFYVVRGSSL
ncbi:hypothetical protein [Anoxybacillus sp. P3H1B]|uniref:hypothetical protein n=1 Tax=Anoxybacillus sp. P3H1B TaxID=1769293 RepID=UPI000AB63ABC|nr:hypothetical protein [Anoxybacillus sp. P3H1B]